MNESTGLFAAAEVGNTVSKADYERELDALRVQLLNLQYDLRERGFSVVLLIAGDDRPGCVNLLRNLHEWMDARYLQNHVMFGSDHADAAERPALARYWRRLPPAGRIGLFLGGWPSSLLRAALDERWSSAEFDKALDHLSRFEKLLVDDGTLVLKFWLHLPRNVVQKRIVAARADPEKHWDFAQHDWDVIEQYDEAFDLIERLLRRSNRVDAPWEIVESTDARYCDLRIGGAIARALSARLSDPVPVPEKVPFVAEIDGHSLLGQLDLSLTVSADRYESELTALQALVNQLSHQACEAGIACVFVFEGVDAAGKGGAIRRLARALPVQHSRVIPIGAPNEVERAHHYLWRFWMRLPKPGEIVVFDRSWYGRLLVERVEGLVPEEVQQRAFDEINEFESTLAEDRFVVCKFWLQIDKDEQLERFSARARTPYKKYKLTPDDFRNRENWDQYQVAAHEMLARTNTSYAPWSLIGANDKRHARLQVLRIVADQLTESLAEAANTATESGRMRGKQGKKGKKGGKGKAAMKRKKK